MTVISIRSWLFSFLWCFGSLRLASCLLTPGMNGWGTFRRAVRWLLSLCILAFGRWLGVPPDHKTRSRSDRCEWLLFRFFFSRRGGSFCSRFVISARYTDAQSSPVKHRLVLAAWAYSCMLYVPIYSLVTTWRWSRSPRRYHHHRHHHHSKTFYLAFCPPLAARRLTTPPPAPSAGLPAPTRVSTAITHLTARSRRHFGRLFGGL